MAQSDFVSRGQDLLKSGQYQEAVKICRLGLLARPTEVHGRLVLAQALLGLRRYDEVLAEMRVAIELDPNNGGAHQLKGEALLRKGDGFAAVEVLERAVSLAPGDPAIAGLLAEARLAIAADGARSTGPSFGDYGDSLTKHYPAHRGGDPDALPGHTSGSFTKPLAAERRRGTAKARTPRPEPLAVGDRSGTVELDPDLDLELDEDDGDDALVARDPTGTQPIDMEDAELLEVSAVAEVPRAPDADATRAGRPGARRTPTPAPAPAPAPVERRLPVPPPRGMSEEVPTVRRPAEDVLGASARAIDDLFPDDDAATGRGVPPRLAGAPAGPLDAVAPAAPGLAGRLPPVPPGATVPTAAPNAPTLAGARPPVMPVGTPAAEPAVPRAGPMAKTLVPPGGGGTARPGPPGGRGPDDMALIRAGLSGAAPGETGIVVTAPSAPARPATELVRPGTAAAPRRRRPLAIALYALLAVPIIGAGVFLGFWIRDLRLDRQIDQARRGAELSARADTWTGWRTARDRLVGVQRAAPSPGHKAALALARAVLAADFHDDLEGARAAVGELGDATGRDAALARAYLALAEGDPARARTTAADAGPAEDPAVGLVLARAALADARWDDAAVAARGAATADARPAAWLAACIADGGRKRWTDAEQACGQALTLVPGHPGATIARARVRAGSGAARQDTAKLVAELEALVTEAARPPAESPLGVSPGEAAWAQLALADVQLAVGDMIAARRALERAQGVRVDDRAFVEVEAAVQLALGDVAAARKTADQGIARWPRSAPLTIVRARALLAAGDVAGAADTLGTLTGAATGSIDALVARGEIETAQGDLDAAASRLDSALARSPDYEDAVVARAEVDLARGDGAAALARVEPRHGATASPRVTVAFAAAKRALRQLEPARAALARLQGGPPGPLTGRVWLETARVERDAGNLAPARAAYAKAAEMLPASREVRLESAILSIDDGDAAGGRDALIRLAGDAADDAAVLVEAARAQTMSGELAAAAKLLDRAEQAGGARAKVARERGRLAQRKRDPAAAVSGLETAVELEPDDLETRLLLMDAYYLAGNETGAQRQADDMLRKFPGRAETFLALGRQALRGDRTTEALTSFTKARDLLAKAPRRRLADALFWLAYATYYGDDLARAKQLLLEAVNLDPFHADARAALGLVLGELNDPGGAAAALERSLALDPENTEGYFLLGQALVTAKRPREAKKWLEKYLERAPDGDNADTARALLKKR